MGAFDYRNFDDRRKNSLSAKQMLLEKFKARPPADDPEMIAKAQARAEVARVCGDAPPSYDDLSKLTVVRPSARRRARHQSVTTVPTVLFDRHC